MRYVLGIDAGGTHTRCQIADVEGRIVSVGYGGPANTNFISPKDARHSVECALSGALKSFGRPVEVAVLAGPHLPAVTLRGMPFKVQIKKKIFVNEFEAALAAGLQNVGGPGVVILSGTGSFCMGRNWAGEEKHTGGWGPTIGDEGSGYDLAREALAAVVRASDGRDSRTILTELICSRLKLSHLDGLKVLLYRQPMRRDIFAGLAECVFVAAKSGDKAAEAILRSGGRRLARLAFPVLDQLFGWGDAFPVILSGGVLSRRSIVTDMINANVKTVRPLAKVSVSAFQPVTGAVIIGLHSIGVKITGWITLNLENSKSTMNSSSGSRGNKAK
ncbi:hypothetical protein HZA56_09960 [Candidatus Poribacteria bacterium]|nr:hypothetical protein [Candidatus Poribacteria bacterium]